MAEIIQEEKAKGGKKRAKKHAPHIDMTPMVDLMCLLITFFMLTTAFSKAKIMEINLPERNIDNNAPVISAARTVNIILGPDNRIFYYPGRVKEEEYNSKPPVLPRLNETNYSATGMRKTLLEKNKTLAKKIDDYNNQVITGKIVISQDSLRKVISNLKTADDTGPIVLIKAYKDSNYGNLVDIFDEMNICGIARYTLVDIAWYEEDMVEASIAANPTSPSGK